MKTLLIIAFILISSVCYGHETKLVDNGGIVIGESDVFTKIVCLGGYKYIIVYMRNGISITQMFEESLQIGTATQPIKCKGKNKTFS